MAESLYKESGVDIEEGARAVEKMKSLTAETMVPGVMSGLGSFASLFDLNAFGNYKEPVLLAGTDGVGTKLKVAFELGIYDTVGIDAVAMCVNDVVCQNGQPMFFLDYLGCGKLDAEKAALIVSGVANGCKESGCALVGGETAEMPGFYKPGDYDIAGFVVGVCEKKEVLDGSKVKANDVLIGLDSSGFHSNGFSLLNKLIQDMTLPFLELYPEAGEEYVGKSIGEVLLTPTRIYVKPVLEATAKFDIHGIAHITGGGFYENIPRMWNGDLTASIQKDQLNSTAPFQYIESLDVSEQEMFSTFNMGTGMILAVNPTDAEDVLAYFESAKFPARIIGKMEPFNGEKVCIE